MTEPLQRVFYGQGGGPNLYLAGDGFEDGGEPIAFRARTNPFFPAGTAGEAIFSAIYLTVTRTAGPLALRVSAYVDGQLLDDCVYEVELPATGETEKVSEAIEVGLFLCICDHLDPSVQLATVAPRGTGFEVLIETLVDGEPGIADGYFAIDSVEVETEVVRESRAAEAVA
jgi:hypothetical protein